MKKRPAMTQKMQLQFCKDHARFTCVDCRSERIAQGPAGKDTSALAWHETWTWDEIEMDHYLALVDGGAHSNDNLVPRCITHHRIKSIREHKANAKAKRLAAGGRKPKKPFPKVHRPMQSHSNPWNKRT